MSTVRRWWTTDVRNLDVPARRRAIILGLVVLAGGIAVSFAIFSAIRTPHYQFDLKIYQRAVRFWLDGNSLYDYSQPDRVNGDLGFTYPPVAALAMAPMAYLPFGVILVLQFIAIVSCNTVLVWLYLRQYWAMPAFQHLVIAGVVSAFSFCLTAISQNATFGQVNLLLGALVVVDVLVLGRKRSPWYGVGIGLAMALKLTPGIFLLLLICQRRWRALWTALGTALAVVVITAIVNYRDSVRFYTDMIWHSDQVGYIDNALNQSWNGVLARLQGLPPSRALWVVGALALLVIGVYRIRNALAADDVLVALTLTGLLGVLVSPVSWIHHIIWVVPSMIILVKSISSRETRIGRRITATILLGTGLLVWVPNTAQILDLPDTGFYAETLWKQLTGSVQFFWLLAFLVVAHDEPQSSRLQAVGRQQAAASR